MVCAGPRKGIAMIATKKLKWKKITNETTAIDWRKKHLTTNAFVKKHMKEPRLPIHIYQDAHSVFRCQKQH